MGSLLLNIERFILSYIKGETVLAGNKARVYYHIEEKGKEYLENLTKDYDTLAQNIDLIVHGNKHYER